MDDFDGDDGFGYEDNWLYVEDEFALADELAESQIADPGYPGTNYEIEMETYDYELYEFWDDMEYADDEYWDYGAAAAEKQDSGQMGRKRKRNASSKMSQSDKKRKVSGKQVGVRKTEEEGNFPVYFLSMQEQLCTAKKLTPVLKSRPPVALLADWRERFPEHEAIMLVEMSEDMQRAALAVEDEDITGQKSLVGMEDDVQGNGEDEWDDEDEEDESPEGNVLESLETGTLKTVLRQRMMEAGLEGVNEGELMDAISKMLNGEGGPDDAAGQLANSLLDQASQGDNTAFTGWLSQQGVTLEDEEDGTTEQSEQVSVSTNPRVANGSGSEGTVTAGRSATHDSSGTRKTARKVEFNVPSADDRVSSKRSTTTTELDERSASSFKASTSSAPTSELAVGDTDSSRRKPAATRVSLKRKGPASDPLETETTTTVPRALEIPASKRTRSGKTR
nr:hypothetical protein CFP56_36405 [Quercus suber]